ncbi:hypothetical protein [Pontibacter mangrovi]|uniref:Uncharacterized protein n=1 Tax=Pontibacter mangrovi TaxID=2589816 RepID=A0A501WK69_9BACT|nr:hypothetical protein [Pontibacter mangrovi]TPE46036.1 hypothetical protein FJM65_01445 [Pontibacter mangrovi]
MERDNWNRDNFSSKGPERPHDQRIDQDQYRGAYRIDTSSDHRNETTWDGYGSTEHRHGQRHPDYNRDYNRNYNKDYNRNYNEDSRYHGYDHDNYNMDSRYREHGHDKHYRSGNAANWNDREREQQWHQHQHHHAHPHRSVHDRIQQDDPYGLGNFNANYGPDPYGQGGGENYGNEAGSLSYGYDGTSNYDPDWNRHYDPLSGERESYHGHYTSRHPESRLNQRNRYDSGNRNR